MNSHEDVGTATVDEFHGRADEVDEPPEYENLIKTCAFEAVQPTVGAVTGYLKNAQDYLEAARSLDAGRTLHVFTLAYVGYFPIVLAVWEFHEVRTKDAGRNLAIQPVSQDLQLSLGEFAAVSKAHERSNNTSYVSPFPPVSKAEAAAMAAILPHDWGQQEVVIDALAG